MHCRQTYILAADLYNREFELLYHALPGERISDEQKTRNRAKYTTSLNRVNMLSAELDLMEEDLGILRWTKECMEYKEAFKLLNERRYRKALDNLERVMVQRLFELTKLGMSGLGEKQHSLILQANNSIRLQTSGEDWQGSPSSRRCYQARARGIQQMRRSTAPSS